MRSTCRVSSAPRGRQSTNPGALHVLEDCIGGEDAQGIRPVRRIQAGPAVAVISRVRPSEGEVVVAGNIEMANLPATLSTVLIRDHEEDVVPTGCGHEDDEAPQPR